MAVRKTSPKFRKSGERGGGADALAKRAGGPPIPAPLAPRFAFVGVRRAAREVRYWLLKTEPAAFSFDDLMRSPDRTTCWDGVRNFQARNFLRDHMRKGDRVLIYHSSAEPPALAGIAEVVREAYPDHTAFDPKHAHFDPKSDPANPTWVMVDVRALAPLPRTLGLPELRTLSGLEKMGLLEKGNRLSVQPVRSTEWAVVVKAAGVGGR